MPAERVGTQLERAERKGKWVPRISNCHNSLVERVGTQSERGGTYASSMGVLHEPWWNVSELNPNV